MRPGRLRLASLSLAAGVVAATLAGCGHSGSDLTSVTIGYPSDTAEHSDLFVCQDQGIFRKHGLDARLTLLKTSSQLVAALSSNTVQIATGDGRAIAAGDLKNTDLKMIALKVPVYFVEMWGRPDIRSVEDLRGKKVGVTVPGSVTDSSTRIMLADKKLTNDVNLVNLNSLSALTSASESGQVDAMVSSPPAPAKLKSRGWHKITDMTNYKTAASVYAVTGEFAKNSASTVTKFLQADLECLSYLHNGQNHDAIISSIQKHTKTDDRSLAEYAYNFFRNIWQTDPRVDEAAVREAFQRAADGGPVPADLSKFIDNSFLDKLRQDGAAQGAGK